MAASVSAKEKFDAAVQVIQSLPKNGSYQPSHALMLTFYGLFKQASCGPCTIKRPAFWDVVGRAKWDAWSRLGAMQREQAMLYYVDELKKIVETMPHTENVQDFIEKLGDFYELVDAGAESSPGSGAIPALLRNASPLRRRKRLASGDTSSSGGSHEDGLNITGINGTGSSGIGSSGIGSSRTGVNGSGINANGTNETQANGTGQNLTSVNGAGVNGSELNGAGSDGSMEGSPERNGGRAGSVDSLDQSPSSETPSSDSSLIHVESLDLSGTAVPNASSIRDGASEQNAGEKEEEEDEEEFCDTSDVSQLPVTNQLRSDVIVRSDSFRFDPLLDGTLERNLNFSESGGVDGAVQMGGGEVQRGGGETQGEGGRRAAGSGRGAGGGGGAGGPIGGRQGGGSALWSDHLAPGGAGGGTGGDPPLPRGPPYRQGMAEQVSLALGRLQQDMDSVLSRLHSLEALSRAQHQLRLSEASEVEQSRGRWWRPYARMNCSAFVLIILWPFFAHLIIRYISIRGGRRMRR